jgi:2,3-bisphosphoglycerate-independent phosphoglycerate mutase
MQKCFLVIVDGLGLNENSIGNAWANARSPFLNSLLATYPSTSLVTHGRQVGLPNGQMGNSEVGHLNIGAGRVILQSLVRITEGIKERSILQSTTFQNFIDQCEQQECVHLIGLLSDGGVHSHQEHLWGLLKIFSANQQIKNIYLHIITDGRDTAPNSAVLFLEELQNQIVSDQRIQIKSLSGRYYAMDRDNRSERTELALEAMLGCSKNVSNLRAIDYVKLRYECNESDEFITPVTFVDNQTRSSADVLVNEARAESDKYFGPLLFWNFRADRMRQLTNSLLNDKQTFGAHATIRLCPKNAALTLTEYEENNNVPILFPPTTINNHLGQVISQQGYVQLRAAETEKYPHVTYFFNGGQEVIMEGEERILVPSPKDVPTYDHKPEMSANELTATVIKKLQEKSFHFGVLNYANCDMVGHTGSLSAAIKAVETVDNCLSIIVPFLIEQGWCIIVTADHGNCEQMINYTDNSPHTAHTTNLVPFVLVNLKMADQQECNKGNCELDHSGALCDIAPTILSILKIKQPEEMTGKSLLKPCCN